MNYFLYIVFKLLKIKYIKKNTNKDFIHYFDLHGPFFTKVNEILMDNNSQNFLQHAYLLINI